MSAIEGVLWLILAEVTKTRVVSILARIAALLRFAVTALESLTR